MSSRPNFEVGSGSGKNTNPSKRKRPSKKRKPLKLGVLQIQISRPVPLIVLPHGSLIGRSAYNAIARLRGFPYLLQNVEEDDDDEGLDIDELENLGPQEEEEIKEDEDEDEDYTEQNLEDDPEVEAGEATLDGIMTMLRGMNKKIDGLLLDFMQFLVSLDFIAAVGFIYFALVPDVDLRLKMEQKWSFGRTFPVGVASKHGNLPPSPQQVIGIAPHSDSSGITILLEVNDVQSLQIKKDGMWIPVKPLPNTFIINIGDTLEILSNGTYRSIEHRATFNSLKERISVATFCSPKMDGEIGPAPTLVTPETPAMFRRISTIDYIKGLLSRKIDGKSYLQTMRIQNEQGKSN
ncbi:hypothetical protein EZV62_027082 [Acer yangbiense]|uniref:Fe2OG dioxygenase domain-containing protein n=1 Tax=Acer yangbiense TaxID=1000413 RepID=A0A5C7GST6_9ROSI|nr:hypothetical protein EZV62_027082 [Acer yangbiense]